MRRVLHSCRPPSRLGVFSRRARAVDIAAIHYRGDGYHVLTMTCIYIRAITVYLAAGARARPPAYCASTHRARVITIIKASSVAAAHPSPFSASHATTRVARDRLLHNPSLRNSSSHPFRTLDPFFRSNYRDSYRRFLVPLNKNWRNSFKATDYPSIINIIYNVSFGKRHFRTEKLEGKVETESNFETSSRSRKLLTVK